MNNIQVYKESIYKSQNIDLGVDLGIFMVELSNEIQFKYANSTNDALRQIMTSRLTSNLFKIHLCNHSF